MDWSDAVILSLRALWDEGLSTAEIGRRLGVTKNAVVGKAHRLDLPARPSPIRRGLTPQPAPRRAVSPTLPSMERPDVLPPGDQREPSAPRPAVRAVDMPTSLAPQAEVAARSAVPSVRPAAVVEDGPGTQASGSTDMPHPDVPRLLALRAAPALRPVASPRRARVVACCWPIGEPGTRSFRFCDAESMAGKPYCDTHAQLAYVKVRDRRDDAA